TSPFPTGSSPRLPDRPEKLLGRRVAGAMSRIRRHFRLIDANSVWHTHFAYGWGLSEDLGRLCLSTESGTEDLPPILFLYPSKGVSSVSGPAEERRMKPGGARCAQRRKG